MNMHHDDPRRPSGAGLWQTWGRLPLLALTLFLVASNLTGQLLAYGLGGGLAVPVLVGSLFGVIMPLEMLRRRGALLPEADLGLDRPPAATLALVVVAALASLAPTSLLAEWSMRIHPVDPAWATLYNEQMPRSAAGIALTAFTVVLVAPLAEEIIFRAFLQRLAAETWGRGAGLLIAGLVFGLIHGESWYLFGLVGIGLMLGLVWELTRSLSAAWLAHAVHNAVSLWQLWRTGGVTTEPTVYGPGDWLLVGVSCAAFVIAAALLARRRLRRAS